MLTEDVTEMQAVTCEQKARTLAQLNRFQRVRPAVEPLDPHIYFLNVFVTLACNRDIGTIGIIYNVFKLNQSDLLEYEIQFSRIRKNYPSGCEHPEWPDNIVQHGRFDFVCTSNACQIIHRAELNNPVKFNQLCTLFSKLSRLASSPAVCHRHTHTRTRTQLHFGPLAYCSYPIIKSAERECPPSRFSGRPLSSRHILSAPLCETALADLPDACLV